MTTTRRTFLKIAGVGAAAIAGVGAACGGPPGGEGEGEGQAAEGEGEGEGEGEPSLGIDVGPVSALNVGDIKQIGGQGILLGRDDGGVYAMSAFCTHAGCDLSGFNGSIQADGNIHCGCHGSVFTPTGDVVRGPAFAPLHHVRVTVSDGEIFVDTHAPVDASTRVAV